VKLQRRVVVTGLGIVSPIGNNIEDAWDACINGISGITFNETGIPDSPVSIGGRIKNLDLKDHLDIKEIRRLDPFIQYSLISSAQAVKDAGIDDSLIIIELVLILVPVLVVFPILKKTMIY
jgi:3-oxoacyl-[acyl-carrier-protein] synthase II